MKNLHKIKLNIDLNNIRKNYTFQIPINARIIANSHHLVAKNDKQVELTFWAMGYYKNPDLFKQGRILIALNDALVDDSVIPEAHFFSHYDDDRVYHFFVFI